MIQAMPDPRKRQTVPAGKNTKNEDSGKLDRQLEKEKNPNVDNPIEKDLKLREGIKRLDAHNAEIAAHLRELGVPVGDDLRIDENKFVESGVVSRGDFENHMRKVTEMEDKFARERAKKGVQSKEIIFGEQMEKFVAALFHKFFNDEYVVVRTSRFDDIFGGNDMVIMHRKTGKIIGTYDAVVGDNKSQRLQQKETKTFVKNIRRDGKLVYGIGVGDKIGIDGAREIIKQQRNDVPVLYLDLSKQELAAYLSGADLSSPRISKMEEKIMRNFLKSIGEQLDQVEDMGSLQKGSFTEPMAREIIAGQLPKIEEMAAADGGQSDLRSIYDALIAKVDLLVAKKIN